ncbi:MAG: histidine phosphatase family protein [Liquorilactobacillus ghanensis]|uniref:histidine phosphatase family protein n=1 Tax=Liquorilactobacillus ghanensis TaxID=399370 RepID=UPI0039EAF75A
MSFTVYFVRHGQTMFNYFQRMQGWSDSPLTPRGIQDAKKAGQHLKAVKFAGVYHSDTTRTQRTCEQIIAANQYSTPQPQTSMNFREQGYGYFEGGDSGQTWLIAGARHKTTTYQELISKYSIEESRDFLKEVDPFQLAENDQEFWQRLNAGFDILRKNQTDGDQVLVVSHGTTIRSIVHHFAPEIDIISQGPINGSVTKLVIDNDQVKVLYYNHYLDNQEY